MPFTDEGVVSETYDAGILEAAPGEVDPVRYHLVLEWETSLGAIEVGTVASVDVERYDIDGTLQDDETIAPISLTKRSNSCQARCAASIALSRTETIGRLTSAAMPNC